MSDRYAAGAIWWGLIDFDDGKGERKKYFVLLSDCLGTEQAAAAVTTSRGARYPGAGASPCGAPNTPAFRLEAGQEEAFPHTTWVQFDNVYPISRASLENLAATGKAGFLHSLADQRLRSLLNCGKKAADIPIWARQLIERKIKVMPAPGPPKPSPQPSVAAMGGGDSDLARARARFGSCCARCQRGVLSLLDLELAQIGGVFSGASEAPANFLADLQVAFEIAIVDCACGK